MNMYSPYLCKSYKNTKLNLIIFIISGVITGKVLVGYPIYDIYISTETIYVLIIIKVL